MKIRAKERAPKPRLNITLSQDGLVRLIKATEILNISQSACIELALRDWFKKEQIE
jgi:hypothetical protein